MSTPDRPDLEPASDPQIETKIIEIDGLHSKECADTIERVLRGTKGVVKADVNLDSESITVKYDTRQTHIPDLHDAILRSGYRPRAFADD